MTNVKKEGAARTFSYVDVFILLLAGLAVSFGIYFFAEAAKRNAAPPHEVSLSAYVDFPLQNALPEAGDPLYRDDDTVWGSVIAVETEKTGTSLLLRVTCLIESDTPAVGDEVVIETPECIRSMWVYEIKESRERR